MTEMEKDDESTKFVSRGARHARALRGTYIKRIEKEKIMEVPDVIGLTPNGDVITYDGLGNQTQIGGPVGQIYAGGWGVAATNAQTGNIYRYNGGTGSEAQWEQIGGPGAMFAVTDDSVCGLSPEVSAKTTRPTVSWAIWGWSQQGANQASPAGRPETVLTGQLASRVIARQ